MRARTFTIFATPRDDSCQQQSLHASLISRLDTNQESLSSRLFRHEAVLFQSLVLSYVVNFKDFSVFETYTVLLPVILALWFGDSYPTERTFLHAVGAMSSGVY